ncbi:MAG: hypothetical protein B7Y41_16000 [Hydrogenophilales bacterium 28-61-23]|nr:MAG: hypothetical protein B7Y41_16000 [Hydrogenophilales bacterium 28-61-23]
MSVGAVSTLSMESIIGTISGILLMSAGILVWYLRYDYRGIIKAKQERHDWLNEQAEKYKREKQAWLRKEAEKYRKNTDPDDF